MKTQICSGSGFAKWFPLMLACIAIGMTAPGADEKLTPPAETPPGGSHDSAPAPYSLEIVNGRLLTGSASLPATLPNVVDALRKVYPDANIVVGPNLNNVQIADLKLRGASLEQTLEALQVASGEAFFPRSVGDRGSPAIDPTTGLPVGGGQKHSMLYILTQAVGNPRRMVHVFNLTGYLEHLGAHNEKEVSESLEHIKRIVSETLNEVMAGQAQASDYPTLQFHPGANLLIVIGSAQAIEVAQQVINALPGVTGPERFPARPPDNRAMDEFRRRYGIVPQGAPAPDSRVGQPGSAPEGTPPAPARK